MQLDLIKVLKRTVENGIRELNWKLDLAADGQMLIKFFRGIELVDVSALEVYLVGFNTFKEDRLIAAGSARLGPYGKFPPPELWIIQRF